MMNFSLTQLWLNSLLLIPIAIVVLGICRLWPHMRPATRHALWLMTLLCLFVPSIRQLIDGVISSGQATPSEPIERLEVAETSPTIESAIADLASSNDHDFVERVEPENYDLSSLAMMVQLGMFEDRVEIEELQEDAVIQQLTVTSIAADTTVDPTFESDCESNEDALPLQNSTPVEEGVATIASPTEGDDVRQTQQPTEEAAQSPTAVSTWMMALDEVRQKIIALPPLPAAVWLGGIAICLPLMLLRMFMFLHHLRKKEPVDAATQRLINQSASQLQLGNVPEACFLDGTISPLVWCGRKKILVLPTSLWHGLDNTSRRAVVLHELAHLKRRDHWVCRIGLVVGIIYWWHPIVWFIRSRIRDEADYSCDAWVTELLPDARRSYANALLESRKHQQHNKNQTTSLALSLVGPAVGLGASSSRTKAFARRLTMIMTHESRPRISIAGGLLAALFATGGLAIAPLAACPPEQAGSADEIAPESPSNTFEEFMQNRNQPHAEAHEVHHSNVPYAVRTTESSRFPAGVRATAPARTVTSTTSFASLSELGDQQRRELAELEALYRKAAQSPDGHRDLADFDRRLKRLEQQMDRLMQMMEMQLQQQQRGNDRQSNFGRVEVRQVPSSLAVPPSALMPPTAPVPPTPSAHPHAPHPVHGQTVAPKNSHGPEAARMQWRESRLPHEESVDGQLRIYQLDPEQVNLFSALIESNSLPALQRIHGDALLVAGDEAEYKKVEALLTNLRQSKDAQAEIARIVERRQRFDPEQAREQLVLAEYLAAAAGQKQNQAAAKAQWQAATHSVELQQASDELARAIDQIEAQQASLEKQLAKLKLVRGEVTGKKRHEIKLRLEDALAESKDLQARSDAMRAKRKAVLMELKKLQPHELDEFEFEFDEDLEEFDFDVEIHFENLEEDEDEDVEFETEEDDENISELPLATIR